MTKVFTKVRLMEANVPNRNGHVYSSEALEQAYKQLKIKCESQGCALGELGTANFSNFICLSEVSHTIRDVELDDNVLLGTVTLLDTPAGTVLQKNITKENPFIDGSEKYTNYPRGPELMVHVRGSGSVKDNVVEDFTLISVDLSYRPAILDVFAELKKQFAIAEIRTDEIPNNEKNI